MAHHFTRLAILAAVFVLHSCTNASLYSSEGQEANLPDRVSFEGVVCAPSLSGRNFPSRVVFAIQNGEGDVSVAMRDQIANAITEATEGYSSRSHRYALVDFNQFSFSLIDAPLGFGSTDALRVGLNSYRAFQRAGPLSITNPLSLAHALLSGIMISDCPGARQRTRYSVVLILFQPARGRCAPYISTQCGDAPSGQSPEAYECINYDPSYIETPECVTTAPCPYNTSRQTTWVNEACYAKEQVRRIQSLMNPPDDPRGSGFSAAQVTVQPIYVPIRVLDSTSRQLLDQQMQAIAQAGATQPIVADVSQLANVLRNLNFNNITTPFKLKTLLAFNRSTLPLAGNVKVDSDGDGLSDDEEMILGTIPTNPDSDSDGLTDGVEAFANMKPLILDEVKGCEIGIDADWDGLNSCEERLLGTSDCMGDSDGDGIPDIIEAAYRTDLEIPEQSRDTDHDGFSNLDEMRRHSDPKSSDVSFIGSHSYTYKFEELPIPQAGSAEAQSDPCPGRARYRIKIGNVGLVSTQGTPEYPEGNNNIYIYSVFGSETGGAIARWQMQQVSFFPPSTREPSDPVIMLSEESFESRP